MIRPEYENLHVVPDNKFINEFIRDLASADELDKHVFLAFNRYEAGDSKFTFLDAASIRYAPPGSPEFKSCVTDLSQYKRIFIHWFLPELESFVRSIPNGPTVYWCFWGEFDASLGLLSRRFRYDRTSRAYARIADALWALNHATERRFPWLKGALRSGVSILPRLRRQLGRMLAVARIDVLLHWNEIDHRILRRISVHPRLRYEEFFYNVVDVGAPTRSDLVDALWEEHGLDGKRVVMVGHSAFPSGNHLEALTLLSQQADDADVRVIAILSYGDPVYREIVIEKGRALFGERFIAVRDFLPVRHYYYLTSKVCAAILNHRLSEGAGNIFRLLLDGKRVYLNPRSTIYQMLKDAGVAVFNMETELSRFGLDAVGAHEAASNREYVLARFNSEKARMNLGRIMRSRLAHEAVSGK